MRVQDEAEYAELVAVLTHRLHRMAYAVCGDRPLAEDAVQSALISAYRTWPRVREADSPEAYLRKMVVNQLLSWRRRKSWSTTPALSRSVEPSRESHENDVVEHQLVWSAVGDLPPRQRAVIVLRYYEGMTEADIAATLDIRPGTVKSQSSAAMSRLRTALSDPELPLAAVLPKEASEMQLEERVTSALRAQTDPLPPFAPDLAVIRASAKAQTRRRAGVLVSSAVVGLIAAIAIVTSSIDDAGPGQPDGVEPIGTPTASPTPSSVPESPDPGGWTNYISDRYSFEVGHPPRWTEVPAARSWNFDTDVADPTSAAHDAFVDPSGGIRVSAWEVPLDPAGNAGCRNVVERGCVETNAYLEAWVEDYCEASGNSPCTGIADRAVELCLEKWDCHPGLLVPFQDGVQAFFSGGIYAADAMTVVAVWRGESDPRVARYGGAQQLLESFLSTMEVWPRSTPRSQRR